MFFLWILWYSKKIFFTEHLWTVASDYGTYPLVIDIVYFVISSYKCSKLVSLVWRLQNEEECIFFNLSVFWSLQ